jgi:hypothetical protein
MRAITVESGTRFVGQSCMHCTSPLYEGEVVVTHLLEAARYGSKDFVVHRRCVESVLATAPVERPMDRGANVVSLAARRRPLVRT